MLVEITYACSMGCSHCMSDCKPDGQHMSIHTFKDALDFLLRHNIPTWNFSGGELFEHPDILQILDILEEKWNQTKQRYPLTFITNGRGLVHNKDIYRRIEKLQQKYSKRYIWIQVTDDSRFYPNPLSEKEKYWLKKLDAIVEPVPGNPANQEKCLYPQGRALDNYPNAEWNTIGPKCVNCILLAKQQTESESIKQLVSVLMANGKVCTPVIAPDGSIKLGESALCPAAASIYDDESTIIEKIRYHKCHKCAIAWDILKEKNLLAYTVANI